MNKRQKLLFTSRLTAVLVEEIGNRSDKELKTLEDEVSSMVRDLIDTLRLSAQEGNSTIMEQSRRLIFAANMLKLIAEEIAITPDEGLDNLFYDANNIITDAIEFVQPDNE